jgi:hypothetical protein
MLGVVMLSAAMLSVVMLSVVMLSVVAPSKEVSRLSHSHWPWIRPIPQFGKIIPKGLTELTQLAFNINLCLRQTRVKTIDSGKHFSLFHNLGKSYQKVLQH